MSEVDLTAPEEIVWHQREMLIWGKTFPELSQRYTETVCTGAVFLDRPGLVRIYPLDERYLGDDQRASKWTVIAASVKRNLPTDPRPESFKIRSSTIRIVRKIDTKDEWIERRRIMLQPDHMVSGMEELMARQAETGQSLGIVRPDSMEPIYLRKVTDSEREAHRSKYDQITRRRELWEPGQKPVPCPRFKPRIRFRGPGDAKSYDRVVLDWEFYPPIDRMIEESGVRLDERYTEFVMPKLAGDPHLVLGNISNYPHTFVIVAVLYFPKRKKPGLFDGLKG